MYEAKVRVRENARNISRAVPQRAAAVPPMYVSKLYYIFLYSKKQF
jgi:hypothetical protein